MPLGINSPISTNQDFYCKRKEKTLQSYLEIAAARIVGEIFNGVAHISSLEI